MLCKLCEESYYCPVHDPEMYPPVAEGIKVTWEYRLLSFVDPTFPEESFVGITEVFYDEEDKIIGWVAVSDYGNQYASDVGELRDSYNLMLSAFDKPTLIERDLPGYVEN